VGKRKAFIFCFLLFGLSHFAPGQELKVEGYFLQDSAMLGERVGYVLKATYPSSLNVLFPDSTYHFDEMEFLGKETFISHSQDSVTLDSAVYYLSNFSLDSVKTFGLPVFEVLRYDSISHFAAASPLVLKLTIDEMPEELAFKETNRYQPIPRDFNYPYLLIGLSALLVITLALFFLFGKKVKKRWKIFNEKRKQKKFLSQWQQAKAAFISNPSMESADSLLGLWKGRMENLTNKPFKEWTSTEISAELKMPELIAAFRKIELIIYAARPAEDIEAACDQLEEISTATFEQKIKELP